MATFEKTARDVHTHSLSLSHTLTHTHTQTHTLSLCLSLSRSLSHSNVCEADLVARRHGDFREDGSRREQQVRHLPSVDRSEFGVSD